MITAIYPISPKRKYSPNKENNYSHIRLLTPTDSINFSSKKILLKNSFSKVGMFETHPKWATAVAREMPLRAKQNDLRTDFERDYTRIMHSEGNDRMRYKAQSYVPVSNKKLNTKIIPENDMISTRSTHVAQVADISKRICKHLGLNESLAEAIALGHDLGHSPFGHEGEKVLKQITINKGLDAFWHEKNSLRMVDDLLTLENSHGKYKNLNLTYAVRDGIICHCGEVDQNGLKPREEALNLKNFQKASQVQPYTWEGCVVKVSDKIAYIGRDIEDALKTGVLQQKDRKELKKIVQNHLPNFNEEINNSSLINLFTKDLIENSSPEKGICFSKEVFSVMKDVKKFNYEKIYSSLNQKPEDKMFKEVLETIFDHYDSKYQGQKTPLALNKPHKDFKNWLDKYSDHKNRPNNYKNKVVYNLDNHQEYRQAIVDFISGMTDKYAQKMYKKIKKEQKKQLLFQIQENQKNALLKGNYKDFRNAHKEFAKEAIDNFDLISQNSSELLKNIPRLSKIGIKKLVFKIKMAISKKTPAEKILKQEAKLAKLKTKYFGTEKTN